MENENEDNLHGLFGKNTDIVETDECAITGKREKKEVHVKGSSKEKVARFGFRQWSKQMLTDRGISI